MVLTGTSKPSFDTPEYNEWLLPLFIQIDAHTWPPKENIQGPALQPQGWTVCIVASRRNFFGGDTDSIGIYLLTINVRQQIQIRYRDQPIISIRFFLKDQSSYSVFQSISEAIFKSSPLSSLSFDSFQHTHQNHRLQTPSFPTFNFNQIQAIYSVRYQKGTLKLHPNQSNSHRKATIRSV